MFSLSDARQKQIDHAERASGRSWRPSFDEAWWWLGLPPILAASIIAIYRVDENFYYAWIAEEGFGLLEFSQFILAASGLVVASRLTFVPYVRGWPLLKWSVIVFAICCLYIAGEEQSWGQHLFGWDTPQIWSQWNRQNETNLHNTFHLLNYLPSITLELGVATGGILMPLYEHFTGKYTHGLLQLFAPPVQLMPAAVCAAVFKCAKIAGPDDVSPLLVPIPNEAVETFLYIFVYYYLVVFARRVHALEASSGT